MEEGRMSLPSRERSEQVGNTNSHYFTRLVERELRNTISEDERAYLHSPDTLSLWDHALSLLETETQTHLSLLNQHMLEEKQRYIALGPAAKSAWFVKKAEFNRKRASVSRFRLVIQKKRFFIKQLRVELEHPSSPSAQEAQAKAQKRSLVCKGYRMAVKDIATLVEERGVSLQLALEVATAYEQQRMVQWAQDLSQPSNSHEHFAAFTDMFLLQRASSEREDTP